MAWKYKDLVKAGRDDTIREITPEEMLHGLQDGYDAVDRYSAQQNVAHRGDFGVGDNAFLDDADWNAVQGYKKQYEDAKLIGDQAGMDAAHNAAQQLRYKYGYSGGVDGSQYNTIVANVAGMSQDDEDDGRGWHSGAGGASGGYNSQYGSRIDALLNDILGREAFSYNKDTDPLYQQYKESYTRAGNRAMQDTLAQVSARTGGLASSYAGTASQQSYNNYMAQLADKVPELQQLAYSMYMDEIANDRADLNTLLGIDDMYYGRYRDDVGDLQWQKQFDYNAYRDSVADSQWQQSFDYNAGRDAISDQQNAQALAQSQIDAILQAGGIVSDALLGQSGYSNEYIAALQNYYQQQAALKAQKGSGGGGGGNSTKPTLTWPQTLAQVEAGNLTPAVLAAYEYYMGAEYDGGEPEWGAGYETGNGNGMLSDFGAVLGTIERNLMKGNISGAEAYLDKVADNFSEDQWEQVKEILEKYGYEDL